MSERETVSKIARQPKQPQRTPIQKASRTDNRHGNTTGSLRLLMVRPSSQARAETTNRKRLHGTPCFTTTTRLALSVARSLDSMPSHRTVQQRTTTLRTLINQCLAAWANPLIRHLKRALSGRLFSRRCCGPTEQQNHVRPSKGHELRNARRNAARILPRRLCTINVLAASCCGTGRGHCHKDV